MTTAAPVVSVWTAPYPAGHRLPTIHYAICGCGWHSPDRPSRDAAWADADAHSAATGHAVPAADDRPSWP